MEARVLQCGGCGASVPPDSLQCPYCRAQLATVACPACLALVPLSATHCPGCGAAIHTRAVATPTGTSCPACAQPLAATRVGEVDVEACQACGGLWLERAVFERLSASRERQGAMLGVLPVPGAPPVLGTEPVRYRPCPVCRQFMNRTNYARHSGVILDVCRTHGLWFDRDELRRVLAFIAGGGLDRAREAELEDLREAQRTAAHPPESRAAFFEAAEERNPTGHGLTGAGLMGLAADLAGMFLHKN